jgi:hypothetical protein
MGPRARFHWPKMELDAMGWLHPAAPACICIRLHMHAPICSHTTLVKSCALTMAAQRQVVHNSDELPLVRRPSCHFTLARTLPDVLVVVFGHCHIRESGWGGGGALPLLLLWLASASAACCCIRGRRYLSLTKALVRLQGAKIQLLLHRWRRPPWEHHVCCCTHLPGGGSPPGPNPAAAAATGGNLSPTSSRKYECKTTLPDMALALWLAVAPWQVPPGRAQQFLSLAPFPAAH